MGDPVTEQAPCVYPGCDDGTAGDEHTPRLTINVICNSCRRRYAKVLRWLLLDYVVLKVNLPAPVESEMGGRARVRRPTGKGHPRAWASDTVRDIAELLNQLEDDLREQLGAEPAPEPSVLEAARVQHAYRYLTNHFDDLCTHPAAGDVAEPLVALHSRIRGAMGFRRHFRTLQAPCPNCDLIGYLTIGDGEGTDRIECEACHQSIPGHMYDFFVRTLADDALDALIAEYDTREAAEFAAKLIK
jgi:hypothetical protein